MTSVYRFYLFVCIESWFFIAYTSLIFAGIVWSGKGKLNGLDVNCREKLHREFLVTPHHLLELENTSDTHDLIVFTVFPLTK